MRLDAAKNFRRWGRGRALSLPSEASFICTNWSGARPGVWEARRNTRVLMRASRAPLCLLLLLALALAPAADAGPALTSVNEYGRLQIQAHKGSTIDEKGVGWGTFNCSVVIALTLSGTLVTANYTAYLQGGSVTGTATAHIHSATPQAAAFSGTISLSRGTGSRAHASGTASFSGTINRTSYAMTTHITGRLRL
jgi:hypothetical protein